MIDLHSHLLPAVDDGARSMQQAVDMCRLAAEDGCRAIVATPHLRHERFWNDDPDQLRALWRELEQRTADILAVHLGAEIAVNSESLAEIDQLPEGDLLPMAGSNYLLLELDFQGLGPDPTDTVHEVTVAGWRPIIAHPERVGWLATEPRWVASLVAAGATMQLTAMSVTGEMGQMVRDAAWDLIDRGLAHFVASDAHDPAIRRPGLSDAYRLVSSKWGEATAQALFVDNPRCVLENRAIELESMPWRHQQVPSTRATKPSLARRILSLGRG